MTKQEIIDYAIQKAEDCDYAPIVVNAMFSYVYMQCELVKIAQYIDMDIAKQSKGLDCDHAGSIEG